MRDKLAQFAKRSAIGRIALVPLRLRMALAHTTPPTGRALQWVFTSREHTNLTYDLSPLNQEHLAFFVAAITESPVQSIRGYMHELLDDRELAQHIQNAVRSGPARATSDEVARYGRRIGWYAFVRAVRPRLVIETGVDKGLGTCVISAALRRNAAEGYEGRCIGVDINRRAGYLLDGRYREYAAIKYGDSLDVLRAIEGPIDMFVNDSDHSADHEAREYELIAPKLSAHALILGDNAHVSLELARFAERTDRRFLFFHERPANHWYLGGGIGVAFAPGARNK